MPRPSNRGSEMSGPVSATVGSHGATILHSTPARSSASDIRAEARRPSTATGRSSPESRRSRARIPSRRHHAAAASASS